MVLAVDEAAARARDEDADVDDVIGAFDDCSARLREGLDVAKRVRIRANDQVLLGPAKGGWHETPEPFRDAGSFARRYFAGGEAPRCFQVRALEALEARRSVLVAVPCGLGKSAPAALFAAARAHEARARGEVAFVIWLCPTQLLCQDMAVHLNSRYAASWPGRGGSFAVFVAGRGETRENGYNVVFLESGGEVPTPGRRARHHVLQGIEDGTVHVGVLVMTPEMLGLVSSWLVSATARGYVSCFVIDEADEEAGVQGSYRHEQASQGAIVRSIVRKGALHKPPPVYAMSGTVAKHDVAALLEALRLEPPGTSAAGGTLVLRTAGLRPGVAMLKGDTGRDVSRTVARLVDDTPQDEATLVFAFTRRAVRRAGDRIAKELPGDVVVTIHGGVPTEEKRHRLHVWTTPADNGKRIAVLNEAGHRGINHPNLGTIIVSQPPSSVPSLLQLVGRAARGEGQEGRVFFAFGRGAYFEVAACLRDDPRKLDAFTKVIRLCETVEECWRSVAAWILGDEQAPAAAVARSACCPACAAKLAAVGSLAPHVERRAVREIAQLCEVVREAAGRTSDQATFRALTVGKLKGWGPNYSVAARERVVLSLLSADVFILEAAKHPAKCVRFVVNESGLARRRRTNPSQWCEFAFSAGEL